MSGHATMNRIFRLVWSDVLGLWIPVAENARGRGKRSGRIALLMPAVAALGLGTAVHAAPPPAQLPTGGKVVAGSATINQDGGSMTINQSSARGAIDWQTFNVGSQAEVRFNQPSASSVTLNRVLDTQASQIFGRISANGQVFLTNPNGIYFSPSSSVEVGGLVATTHGISNEDFMAGKTSFERNGATGSVINEGSLNASNLGGYIALLAPEVRNSGVIVAKMGTVALASGEAVTLQFDGNSLAGIIVSPSAIKALVENRNAVFAPGGLIILSARAANAMTGGVIKNSGTLEAGRLANHGGRIVLEASSSIENSGRIDASAATGQGGSITLNAPQIVNSGAIAATGEAGGSVYANATESLQNNGTIDVHGTLRKGGLIVAESLGSLSQDGSGRMIAFGSSGGTLTLRAATQIDLGGTLDAHGTQENGGTIVAAGHDIALRGATLEASSVVDGGNVSIQGGHNPFGPTDPLEPGQPPAVAILDSTRIRASGRNGRGGTVTLTGERVGLFDDASIDATGATGGGNIFVGGGWQGGDAAIPSSTSVYVGSGVTLDASATDKGDGGTVVAWSDVHNAQSATRAYGTFLAKGGGQGGNGGRIETSGHWLDTQGARGSTAAPAGKNGYWLFDPYDVTIDTVPSANGSFAAGTWTPSGSGSVILNTDIEALLDSGTSVTVTTSGGGGEAGDITVNAAVNKSSGASNVSLTLAADNSILLNQGIAVTGGTGKLDVVLHADADNSGTGGILMTSGTSIVTNGGDITLSGGADVTTGYARGDANTGDRGIWTQQNTTLDATGSISGGNIVLRGTGTVTGEGMLLGWGGAGPASAIKTNFGGAISLTGTGGGQSSGRWVTGVSLWNTAIQTDTGAINITGTGGAADGADDNSGVLLDTNGVTTDNRIVSSTGAINITGTRGTGTTTLGAGIQLGSGSHAIGQDGSLVVSSSSDITLETDSLQAGSASLQSSGALTIQPHTASATIGIGDGASGILDIRAAEISTLKDGFSSITIGRADGTGAIDVQSAAFADDLVIRTPSGAGDIAVNGALSTGSGSQAGNITLQAGNNVSVASSGSITTDNKSVTLNSDRDASGAGAISLASGASVSTGGGDITLRGGSASLNTLPDPTVTATLSDFIFNGGLQFTSARGDGAGVAGVTLTGSALNAGGGDIQIRGIGDGGEAGISATGGATVTTTGSGTISLYGAGGSGATDGDGVNISGSGTAVTSSDGDITIYGQGRGTTASQGVVIDGTSAATAPKLESANGDVLIRGASSATGNFNQGVLLTEGSVARTTGTGNVDMIGRGDGTGSDSHGIFLLTNGLVQTTGGGSIALTGYGSTSGTTNNNEGVKVMNGSLVEVQTGAGNMNIDGTGGSGSSYNIGVNALNGTFRMGSAATGTMTVTGAGGAGSVTGNWGILAENGGIYESLGAAPIELIGTGGTGSDNGGIKLTGGTTNRIGSDTMTGSITLTGDTIDLDGVAGGTMSVQSSGALEVRPLTAGAAIGIGNGASGTLNLDNTELGWLQDGFSSITIGRSNGSGAIDVRGYTFKDPLTIRTPSGSGSITVNGALATGSASQAGSILLQAANNVTLAASSSITTQGRDVILDADYDASTAGAITLSSGSSVASNGGNIVMGGGADPTTGYASGGKAVWIAGASVSSGGGDITLRGKGKGANGSADTPGIKIETSTIDSGAGSATLVGDSYDGSAGIFIASGGSITSAKTNGTAISVTGTAGQTLASDNSPGILMIDGSLTTTGTGGNIVLVGQGGVSNTSGNTFNAKGVAIAGGAGSTIQAEGTLSITGTARNDVGDNSIGVSIENYSGNIGAKGGITITGNSRKTGITDVQLRQDSGTNTLGNGTTGSITLVGDRIALAVGAGTTAMQTAASGNVSLLARTAGRAVSAGGTDSATVLGIDNTELNRITTGTLFIGRAPGDATAPGALSVDSALIVNSAKIPSLVLRGTDVTIDSDISATGVALTLTGGNGSTVSGGGNLTASGLLLNGTNATYTLNTATSNNIGTLAADNTGTISFRNSAALDIGTVASVDGISAGGPVVIETTSGDLTVAKNIATTDTGNGAVVLNAGRNTAAGTSTGGNILIIGNPSITTGSGGRATLFSGGVSGSTGLTALAGSGSGRFRYDSDESAANYSAALGTGIYAIYREQPTVTVTASDDSKTYDGQAYSGGNGVGYSGFANGDTSAALTGTPGYGGTSQGAVNAGTYAITPSGLGNGLGYALSYADGAMTVNKATLTVTANDDGKTYDGLAYSGGNGVTYSGFVNGETPNVLGGALIYDGSSQGAVESGHYTITPSGYVAANYDLIYQDGMLTINAVAPPVPLLPPPPPPAPSEPESTVVSPPGSTDMSTTPHDPPPLASPTSSDAADESSSASDNAPKVSNNLPPPIPAPTPSFEPKLTTTLTAITADASSGNGISVSLVREASPENGGFISVLVPRDMATRGSGFSFPMPPQVSEAAKNGAVALVITTSKGNPLPAWLRYDPQDKVFVASAVPDGALPIEVVISIGTNSWRLMISERAE